MCSEWATLILYKVLMLTQFGIAANAIDSIRGKLLRHSYTVSSCEGLKRGCTFCASARKRGLSFILSRFKLV